MYLVSNVSSDAAETKAGAAAALPKKADTYDELMAIIALRQEKRVSAHTSR
jgi:hypothetical protein